MIRTNNRRAHRAGLAVVATLVMSFAVAFLALSSAPADAATTTAAPAASVPSFVPRTLAATPHGPGPYSAITDECATCHRVHTGQNRNVLKSSAPQSTLCFTCHDGTGATNVLAQYTDPAVPANNPATREFYSHDARVTTSHTKAQLNEFGGVSNRHSECGDCHNPHKSNPTNSTETATGWTASGRLEGISGVSVSNSPTPDQPPTSYTFLNGTTSPITFEYQLCFKCHSGFTTLPSNSGFTPSNFLLDKAVEFNPNNPSFHPVEAPGKNPNTLNKMNINLSQTTTTNDYKQWDFTTGSTIRCSNCHASSTKFNLATPPSAGGDLPPHTSAYQGILLRNYRNRVLKSDGEAYNAADFALCFMCHTDSPFNGSGDNSATNFSAHRKHVNTITRNGLDSTDIDTAGAGQGLAICAECHFRIHSTSYKDGTQDVTGAGLVNFAPNVTGARRWSGGSSCSLTCHGQSEHD